MEGQYPEVGPGHGAGGYASAPSAIACSSSGKPPEFVHETTLPPAPIDSSGSPVRFGHLRSHVTVARSGFRPGVALGHSPAAPLPADVVAGVVGLLAGAGRGDPPAAEIAQSAGHRSDTVAAARATGGAVSRGSAGRLRVGRAEQAGGSVGLAVAVVAPAVDGAVGSDRARIAVTGGDSGVLA